MPTIAESVPGYEFVGTWYGMFAPANVSRAIVTRIHEVLNTALQTEALTEILVSQGSEPTPMLVEAFQKLMREDCPTWACAVKLAGVKE